MRSGTDPSPPYLAKDWQRKGSDELPLGPVGQGRALRRYCYWPSPRNFKSMLILPLTLILR